MARSVFMALDETDVTQTYKDADNFPDLPEAVAKRLGYAIKLAQHGLRLRMDEALRPLGLTAPKYDVLCALEAEPGMSNARLARALFVTAQTMHGILSNLARAGLVERNPVQIMVARSAEHLPDRASARSPRRIKASATSRIV